MGRVVNVRTDMTKNEIIQREALFLSTIRKRFPDFAKACAADADVVILHQDSFAAAYQETEYLLLGMAIKHAGLCGKDVQVIGRNRQTVRTPPQCSKFCSDIISSCALP
jgi:uncharacterized circularly permuted ATP-grasp superfamily protein